MEHSFDVDIACRYGICQAVVIRHFVFWIKKNKADNKNFTNGRTWTFTSYQSMSEVFPYFTPKQIRTAIDKLIKNGVLVKEKFRGAKNNRNWYAFADEEVFLGDGNTSFTLPQRANYSEPPCPRGQTALPKKANHLAPEGKLINKEEDKSKDINKKDNYPLSQKTSLSGESQSEVTYAISLLMRYGVDRKVARSIVCDQHTPLTSIEEVIKNGLAKEDEARKSLESFKLKPGYIVKALNSARAEGKVVKPTKLSKKLTEKIKRFNPCRKTPPKTDAEIQLELARQKAALEQSEAVA